jgi:hypothetical protein
MAMDVKDKVSQGVGDQSMIVFLDPLADVRMMLNHDGRPLINQPARKSDTRRRWVSGKLKVCVERDDNKIY